jgi:hypothetical protein
MSGEALSARYLEDLRRRVAWQAEAAYGAEAPAVEPPPEAPPSPTDERGGWTLRALERLADERSAGAPERAQELSYVLLYLRGYADLDGRLPKSIDPSVSALLGDAPP